MAGGFAKDGAVQDQIDATVEDAVERARGQLPSGESLEHCEDCDAIIPEADKKAGDEHLEMILQRKSDQRNFKKTFIDSKGRDIPLNTSIECVRNSDGKTLYFIAAIKELK